MALIAPLPSPPSIPSDRPITVTAKHPGCYTYSVGACTPGTVYGMCGNTDTQLIISAD